jgi:hypothetical protein
METTISDFALESIVYWDRVFNVWTLWIESGLGVPLRHQRAAPNGKPVSRHLRCASNVSRAV